jgi:DNA-binding NarL/FixJ family response regulator
MTRVLIVDDQAAFRHLLRQLLTRAGLSVVGEAETLPEAEALVEELLPDLAIVDVVLPGMDGISGVSFLKDLCPSMRLILVSSYVDRADVFRIAAEDVGADAFIPKDELDIETVRAWHQETRHRPSAGRASSANRRGMG